MGLTQTKPSEDKQESAHQEYISTKFLLDMLMNEKLRNAEYNSAKIDNKECNRVFEALYARSKEVEHTFMSNSSEASLDMASLLHSPDNMIDVLDSILQPSGPRWGAVFAMFALAGMMFDSLMKKNRLHKMYLVVDHINQ